MLMIHPERQRRGPQLVECGHYAAEFDLPIFLESSCSRATLCVLSIVDINYSQSSPSSQIPLEDTTLSHSDEHGFDRWTRRRFGGAAGLAMGLTLAGVGLGASDAGKKKKKKKKRKKKEDCRKTQCNQKGAGCFPGASPCCDCLECREDSDGFNTCQDPED